MVRASIDLGTNTCLLLIAETGSDHKITRVLHDEVRVVRLGQGVDKTRQIAPEAAARTLACLKDYAQIARSKGLDPGSAFCVATSQARDAQNGAEFFKTVQSESGFKFKVISGEEEARLTFLGGLLPGMDPERSVVIDIGGGSTEFMATGGGQSLDMGCVRFTERFLKSDPVTDQEFWACQEEVDRLLEPLKAWRKTVPQHRLIAVAGTATTLAGYHLGIPAFDAEKIDGLVLTRGDIHRMMEELKWRTIAERQTLPCIEPGRADILLAGSIILWRSLEVLGFADATVSSRGLRFGALEFS